MTYKALQEQYILGLISPATFVIVTMTIDIDKAKGLKESFSIRGVLTGKEYTHVHDSMILYQQFKSIPSREILEEE